MTSYSCRQKKVKVPVAINQERFFVQSLNKGDRVTLPPGCSNVSEPVLLPDELFQRFEHMPTVFKKLPFAFTADHEKQDAIQKILHFSFKQQKDNDVSYCPGFACHVIQSCFNAIDVACSKGMGYRKIDKEKSTAHMWLIVDDNILDVTYEKYMTKNQISILEKTTPKCYQQNFFAYNREKVPTDKDEFSQVCIKKNVDIFWKEPSKGLALGLNQEQLYVYYFAMIHFMWESFHVNISAMEPSVRHFCWCCGKFPPHSKELLSDIIPDNCVEVEMSANFPGRFKHCSQCMVAKYCSMECQSNDWDDIHRFTCVSRVSGPNVD